MLSSSRLNLQRRLHMRTAKYHKDPLGYLECSTLISKIDKCFYSISIQVIPSSYLTVSFVFFLGNHTVSLKNWLNAGAKPFQHSKCVSLFCLYLPRKKSNKKWSAFTRKFPSTCFIWTDVWIVEKAKPFE